MAYFRRLIYTLTFCVVGLTTGIAQEIREYSNLVYQSPHALENPDLQALNLVIPSTSPAPPLFVWIGGGAWSYVDRNGEMELARQFAKSGIAVASVGHRLSSATWKDPSLVTDNKHPDHIQDVAAAVKWLVDNAARYGYDPNRLFIGGYSSGAHLAALLCLNPKYLQEYDLEPTLFNGVIPIAGAYDIPHYHQAFVQGTRKELARLHVEAVFGDTPEGWEDASPISYANQHTVPMLLISESGTYNYTALFEEKMKYKADFSVHHYTEMNHAELWKNMSFSEVSDCRNRIVAFINNYNPNVNSFD